MNAIDLTTLVACRGYLGLVPDGNGGPPSVNTTVAASVTPNPVAQAVTPGTMAHISVGMALLVDSGASAEYVVVTAITSTTFSGIFALAHTGPFTVLDQTDAILASLITGASQYFLDRTALGSLNSLVNYTERYDGSGSARQFLHNTPITAVSLLQIGSVRIPQSPDYIAPGFVIDQRGRSLAIIGCPTGSFTTSGFVAGSTSRFAMGIQNVLVQYTAGYSSTPADVQDKCTQLVGVNYKRKSWIDQTTQPSQGGSGGAFTYRGWEVPPEVERVINLYSRSAIV